MVEIETIENFDFSLSHPGDLNLSQLNADSYLSKMKNIEQKFPISATTGLPKTKFKSECISDADSYFYLSYVSEKNQVPLLGLYCYRTLYLLAVKSGETLMKFDPHLKLSEQSVRGLEIKEFNYGVSYFDLGGVQMKYSVHRFREAIRMLAEVPAD